MTNTAVLSMTKSEFPKSVRKFIRLEKAKIRATVLDLKKQEEMISQLYQNISKKPVADGKISKEKNNSKTKKREDKKTGKKENVKTKHEKEYNKA